MEVLPDIHRIRLPMANNPLRYVNSYLIKGGDEYALVDCGWDTPDVLATLQETLHALGLRLEDIRTLVITHNHTDHYGLAGTLKRLGNLRLLMHRVDWWFARTHLTDLANRSQLQSRWLQRHGLPTRDWPEDDRRSLENLHRFSVVAPDLELEEGDRIQVGPYSFQVLWTPGHSDGHLCLYDVERGVLLAGDHVLDPITPRVSVSLGGEGNPLGVYLDSLRRVADLEVALVLPSHGRSFTGLARRVGELLAHHDQRESTALEALRQGPKTAAEVAEHFSWTRRGSPFSQLGAFQQRMALGETLAHLADLSVRQQVVSVADNGHIYYHAL